MNPVPETMRSKINQLYQEGQEYKRQWNNLTIRKIAEKWETTPDTIRAIAAGTAKPTGQTLIEESDVPIIKELLRESYNLHEAFKARSPKAISESTGVSLNSVYNIVRSKK